MAFCSASESLASASSHKLFWGEVSGVCWVFSDGRAVWKLVTKVYFDDLGVGIEDATGTNVSLLVDEAVDVAVGVVRRFSTRVAWELGRLPNKPFNLSLLFTRIGN